MATVHPPIWQLQEAKNRFSEVISAAEQHGPQTITRHGHPVALVVPVTSAETSGVTVSAWDVLRDDLVAALGGPPDTMPRTVDPVQTVPLPW
jgi:prevent-host-death family protein